MATLKLNNINKMDASDIQLILDELSFFDFTKETVYKLLNENDWLIQDDPSVQLVNLLLWRNTYSHASWRIYNEGAPYGPLALPKNETNFLNIEHLSIVGDNNCQFNYDCKEDYKYFDQFIHSIPNEIAILQNLKSLTIGNTIISLLGDGISQLQNLTCLDLYHNKICQIPKSISYLKKLESLSLRNNQLNALPDEITTLTNLTYLNLTFNPNLQLTEKQKEWLTYIEANGCEIEIDENLL